MSSQTISRAGVQEPAKQVLLGSIFFATPWMFFTAVGLGHMGSLLTVGSLLLFVVIGVVTGALVATSICVWCAARRLPPTRLSPQAVAQEELKKGPAYQVGLWLIIALCFASLLLAPHHGEFVYPVGGLIFGNRCSARNAPTSEPVVLPDRRSLHPPCRGSRVGTAPRGDTWWSLHLASDRRPWLYRDFLAEGTVPAVWGGTIAPPRDGNEVLIRLKLMVALS